MDRTARISKALEQLDRRHPIIYRVASGLFTGFVFILVSSALALFLDVPAPLSELLPTALLIATLFGLMPRRNSNDDSK
jgi:hypothetical protein